MENNKIMQKILICLYIVIALLTINTVVLILANADVSNPEPQEEETSTYDVSMFTEITADDIDEVKEIEGIQVIYVGQAGCGYCRQFLPSLQKAQEEYGYKTKYLDIAKVTTEEIQNKILELDNDEKIIANNFWATPKVLIVKDGKLVDVLIGADEYSGLTEFLERNGITK